MNRISLKFILPTTLGVLFVFLIFGAYLLALETKKNEKELAEKLEYVYELVNLTSMELLWQFNLGGLDKNARAFFTDQEIAQIKIMDDRKAPLLDLRRFSRQNALYSKSGPIVRENQPIGELLVAITSNHRSEALALARNRLLLLFATIYILIVILVSIISRFVSVPIGKMEQLFSRAAHGDLSVRWDKPGNDEIGRACRSFNLMMNQMNQLTHFDSITGLPNLQVLLRDFRDTKRKDATEHTGIVLLGINRFSRTNDMHGYQKGNEALRLVAERLQSILPLGASLYRGQSDQFLLLWTTRKSVQETLTVVEDILADLEVPLDLSGTPLSLQFSAGVSLYPRHGRTPELLIENAGLARSSALASTKKKVTLFDPSVRKTVTETQVVEDELKLALKEKQFFLVYQPLIKLSDQSLYGFEALLRWSHPSLGLVPPSIFIPIAEKIGLIEEIGSWVLKEACKEFRSWQKKGLTHATLSINVSPEQLVNSNLLAIVLKTLEENQLDARFLELELTESALIHDLDRNIHQIQRLRSHGLRISIDDFGTGYSSLSYLVRLPVDALKIDRSFVVGLQDNLQAQTVVSTIIAMGKSLNLHQVAEGIETQEQLQFLKKHNCGIGQGYLFSKPLPAEEAERFWKNLRKE